MTQFSTFDNLRTYTVRIISSVIASPRRGRGNPDLTTHAWKACNFLFLQKSYDAFLRNKLFLWITTPPSEARDDDEYVVFIKSIGRIRMKVFYPPYEYRF